MRSSEKIYLELHMLFVQCDCAPLVGSAGSGRWRQLQRERVGAAELAESQFSQLAAGAGRAPLFVPGESAANPFTFPLLFELPCLP